MRKAAFEAAVTEEWNKKCAKPACGLE
jgi:hypothetical protein